MLKNTIIQHSGHMVSTQNVLESTYAIDIYQQR